MCPSSGGLSAILVVRDKIIMVAASNTAWTASLNIAKLFTNNPIIPSAKITLRIAINES